MESDDMEYLTHEQKRNRFHLFRYYAILSVLMLLLWGISSMINIIFNGSDSNMKVILISMDGFRHDYIELVKSKRGSNSLPNFDRLIANGVRIKKCENGYPTITAPNHHTILTGVYPEFHGIIANNIWDLNYKNETFDLDSQKSLDLSHWISDTSIEPIWVELLKNGFKVGSMLWPFVDQPFEGLLPNKMQSEYATLNMGDSSSMRYSKRVDRVLRWMSDQNEPLDFVMMYFEEPDFTGHAYGPNSEELAEMIVELDKTLGFLMNGLDNIGVKANIILTSDHGMTQLSAEKIIHINQCLIRGTYRYTWLSTSAVYDEVYNRLKKCHPEMNVYKIADVPAFEMFNKAPKSRRPEFVLIANPGWVMVDNDRKTVPIAGNHGYSRKDSEMNPILIFAGPDFNHNKTKDYMANVEIYLTLVMLFNIEPHLNNGTQEHLSGLGPKFVL